MMDSLDAFLLVGFFVIAGGAVGTFLLLFFGLLLFLGSIVDRFRDRRDLRREQKILSP